MPLWGKMNKNQGTLIAFGLLVWAIGAYLLIFTQIFVQANFFLGVTIMVIGLVISNYGYRYKKTKDDNKRVER